MSKSDYVTGIYSQLLELQESRQPFEITTSLRHFERMLIRTLAVTRDRKTSQVLSVSATCREIIIVSTQSATLPPREDQRNPAGTAEVVTNGSRQLIDAFPAPGGSVPPNKWGPE